MPVSFFAFFEPHSRVINEMMKGGKRKMKGNDDNPLHDAARCHFRAGNAMGFMCTLICPLFLIVSILPNNPKEKHVSEAIFMIQTVGNLMLESKIEK